MTRNVIIQWDLSLLSPPTVLTLNGNNNTNSIFPQLACLWCGGNIVNRLQLISLLGEAPDISDALLLLSLYSNFGEQSPNYIFGPFAWVLWDGKKQKILAVADRAGNNSLYYTVHKEVVLLSDDIEPILKVSPNHLPFNVRSLIAQINGLAPVSGETFYENIRKIEPGNVLTITQVGIAVSQYWRVEPQPILKLSSDAAYASAFREILFQVVYEYLPLEQIGITLSSGMDSTSVAAAVRTVAPQAKITAFSWIAPELPSADEGEFTAAICKHLDIPAVTIRADLLWPLYSQQGIQTSIASPFYNFYTELWQATFQAIQKQGIFKVFSGFSGDHLFAGSLLAYADLLLTGRWLELAHQLSTNLPYSGLNLGQLIWLGVIKPFVKAYHLRATTPVPWLDKRYHDLFQEYFANPPQKTGYHLPGKQKQLSTLTDPLIPPITEMLNKQAANYGIEIRHPLRDHRLVEFAASLPTSQLFRASQGKIIVRNAMQGYLPKEVCNLLGKIVPSAIAWRGLKEREQAKVWNLMTDMRAADLGLVNVPALHQTYKDYLQGKHNSGLFWHTLTLEDWLRRYF